MSFSSLLHLFSDEKIIPSNVDFSKNIHFQQLMKNPEQLKNITLKNNINTYLQSQIKNIEEMLKNTNLDDILSEYRYVEPLMFTARGSVFIENQRGKQYEEVFLSRCNDNADRIIKLYHLALLNKEEDIAEYIQQQIILKLQKTILDHDITAKHAFRLIRIVAQIAFASDCFDQVKTDLYQQAENILAYYFTCNANIDDFFMLFKFMKESELLDAPFILTAKKALPFISDQETRQQIEKTILDSENPDAAHEMKSNITKLLSKGTYAQNDQFLLLMNNPELFKNLELKNAIKKYLLAQKKIIADNMKNIKVDNMLDQYGGTLGIIPTLLKHRGQFFIEGYPDRAFTGAPLSLCDDENDIIIKLYHLALQVNENDIAKSLQKMVVAKLEKYISNLDISYTYANNIIIEVSRVAYAVDCFNDIKKDLYRKAGKILEYYLNNPSKDEYDYYMLFIYMQESNLLDEAFALKGKKALSHIKNPDRYYRILNIINEVQPNTVSLEEQKTFVQQLLKEKNKSVSFENYFVEEFLKSPLAKDKETFTLFLKNIKLAKFSDESYRYWYSNHFANKTFNLWQNELIQKAGIPPRIKQLKEEKERDYRTDRFTPSKKTFRNGTDRKEFPAITESVHGFIIVQVDNKKLKFDQYTRPTQFTPEQVKQLANTDNMRDWIFETLEEAQKCVDGWTWIGRERLVFIEVDIPKSRVNMPSERGHKSLQVSIKVEDIHKIYPWHDDLALRHGTHGCQKPWWSRVLTKNEIEQQCSTGIINPAWSDKPKENKPVQQEKAPVFTPLLTSNSEKSPGSLSLFSANEKPVTPEDLTPATLKL